MSLIYVYNQFQEIKNNIAPINKDNYKTSIILVDEELEIKHFEIKHNRNLFDILNQKIEPNILKSIVISKKNKNYKTTVSISQKIMSEFRAQIGIFQILKLENEIYILNEFFTNMSLEYKQNIVFKNKNEFRIFEDSEVYIVDNIYAYPKYKLWEYGEDYELKFYSNT